MKQLVLFLLTILVTQVYSQVPRDNPYTSRYNSSGHWSDSLRWTNVIVSDSITGLIDQQSNVDSLILQKTMAEISGKGGGVLYFPAGSYYFNYDLYLQPNVIIRGQSPSNSVSAKSPDFLPPTKFIFPKYIPSFTGTGTPNSTAFKKIFSKKSGIQKFGLVNLDIDRAYIFLHTDFPNFYHEKVIIWGIRQNNATNLSPDIPSKIQTDEGHGWQRWPFPYGENIVLCVRNKGVIANCRINDRVTDNFSQPDYLTSDGYLFDNPGIDFRYDMHNGIKLEEVAGDSEIRDNYIKLPRQFIKIITTPGVKSDDNELVDLITPEEKLITRDGNLAIPDHAYTGLFKTKTFLISTTDSLRYKLLEPVNYKESEKYPLVLFFHGDGEKGYDQNPLIHFAPQVFCTDSVLEKFPFFVLAPHLSKAQNWASNDANPSSTLKASIDLIKELEKEFNIDKKRIYVIGISAGAQPVWDALLHYPNFFAAGVPLANMRNFSDTELKLIKNKPIWLSAGALDPYIPINYARFFHSKLKQAKVDVKYNEYHNVGHFSWVPIYNESSFLPWLLSKKK